MAFNPFSGFRKHQKIYMAGLILLSMIVFVLCSGIGTGGLEDIILRATHRRGNFVATVYGRAIYQDDLRDLREKRNLANDYMQRALHWGLEVAKARAREWSKSKDPQTAARLGQLNIIYTELLRLKGQPRFFGGDKLDDLVDFLLWQHQADVLGISFQDQQVLELVRLAVFGGELGLTPFDLQARLPQQLLYDHPHLNYAYLWEALRQEFRVQVARLALLGSRPLEWNALTQRFEILTRNALTPYQLWTFYRENTTPATIALLPVPAEKFLSQVALPPKDTLRVQLEDLFRRYREVRYDPASPVPGFIAPEQVKVTWVTADPDSPYYRQLSHLMTTLIQAPLLVWTPVWPGLGEALDYALQATAWDSYLERKYEQHLEYDLLGKLSRAWGGREALLRYVRSADFRPTQDRNLMELRRYVDPSLTEPYTLVEVCTRLYSDPPPSAAATLVASSLPPAIPLTPVMQYQAAATATLADRLAPLVQTEVQRRLPVGASLVLLGSQPTPFSLLTAWQVADSQEQFLDWRALEPDLRRQAERQLAVTWVQEVMRQVRRQLEQDRGVANSLILRLEQLQNRYPGLQVHHSTGFRTPFDIARDPALQGFVASFEKYRHLVNQIEGRSGTERALKEDDFYRLFFGGEPFSVGNTAKYDPRPWPPVVTVQRTPLDSLLQAAESPEGGAAKEQQQDLWQTADQPILFWKTDYQPEQVRQTLAEAWDDAVQAWKLLQARTRYALPQAEKLAQALVQQPATADLDAVLHQQAAQLGVDLVVLHGVARLVPEGRGELAPAAWKPYTLPPGLIPYPSEDMAQQLLTLRQRQQPIEIKASASQGDRPTDLPEVVQQLNKLNAALFKASTQKKGPLVQVLTNRPRTLFFITVVLQEATPSEPEFLMRWQDAAHAGILRRLQKALPEYRDTLLDEAQREQGRQLEQHFLRHLRVEAGLQEDLSDLKDARKEFEGS